MPEGIGKVFDWNKPWWQNFGCQMQFRMDSPDVIRGKLVRIDANEYRKYAVIQVGDKQRSLNIDHIVSVEEV